MPDVVIVGVDGSDAGGRAAELAVREALPDGARVVIACVVPWSPYAIHTIEDNERRPAEKQREIEHVRTTVLGPLVERLDETGAQVDTVVRHGHPAETLVALAKEHGAGRIVVGRTGQSRVRTLLFGSTPSNLIQISPIPVTVVP